MDIRVLQILMKRQAQAMQCRLRRAVIGDCMHGKDRQSRRDRNDERWTALRLVILDKLITEYAHVNIFSTHT